jgi:hypothetical protein
VQLLIIKNVTDVISCFGESTASKTTKCSINEGLKITAFWDLMPCRQVPAYILEEAAACIFRMG